MRTDGLFGEESASQAVRSAASRHRDERPLPRQSEWAEEPPSARAVAGGRSFILRRRFTVAALGLLVTIALFALPALKSLPFLIVFEFAFFAMLLSRGTSARPEDESLLEDPDDPNVCLATIVVRQDGLMTGADTGAIYIEGASLVFSGRRTSFRVGGQDLTDAVMARRMLATAPQEGDGIGFGLRHPDRRIWISVVPVTRPRDKDIDPRIRFMAALRAWRAERPPSSEESQYAPLRVDPRIRVECRATSWQLALSGPPLGLGALATATVLYRVGEPILATIAFVVGLALAVASHIATANRHDTDANRRLLKIMRDEAQNDRLIELGFGSVESK